MYSGRSNSLHLPCVSIKVIVTNYKLKGVYCKQWQSAFNVKFVLHYDEARFVQLTLFLLSAQNMGDLVQGRKIDLV